VHQSKSTIQNSMQNSIQSSIQIVWPIVYIGGVIGLLLSWLVLSGDQQGRVNLFYLLLVYLFIPVMSVLLSLFSLLFGKGINLARLITAFPFLSSNTQSMIRKSQQLNMDKYWFLMQSQVAAIAFSVASLSTFFTLLIATDLNFVWRSTILEPSNVLPLLEIIAWPWQFWSSAQPSLSLLEMTQDSRMLLSTIDNTNYGAWWKFILATQICYSLILRVMLLAATKFWLNKKANSDLELTLQGQIKEQKLTSMTELDVGSVIHKLPEGLTWLNWDNIPESVWSLLETDGTSLGIGKLINRNQLMEQEQQQEQLIIVKSWEAPLGELEDYLNQGFGYILPLDWHASELQQLQLKHLQEWQRFTNNLASWTLYIPSKYMPKSLPKLPQSGELL